MSPISSVGVEPTDVGNARLLAQLLREDHRFMPFTRQWWHWDGHQWQPDHARSALERAKGVAEVIRERAKGSPAAQTSLMQWAERSRSRHRLEAMVALAESDPTLHLEPDRLDRHPYLLNVANGTLDLLRGQLRPPDRSDFISRRANAPFVPGSVPNGIWDEFLEQVLPDPEIRQFLARAVGYSLTGAVNEHVMFVLVGDGANGKSTFVEAIRYALGDYSWQADPDLLVQRHSAHPTGIADLEGHRFVTVSEIDKGAALSEATVKRLIGGDRIVARRMHGNFREFEPCHKLWLATNYLPSVRGRDEGIWRRLCVIPFEQHIAPRHQDKALLDKLRSASAEVLEWAILGLHAWRSEGLAPPSAIVGAAQEYRLMHSPLGQFLRESTVRDPQSSTKASALYDRYTDWAKCAGAEAIGQRAFGVELRKLGLENVKSGTVAWRGLRLRA